MITTQEKFLTTSDGLQIYTKLWGPKKFKHLIFITHGQGEHADCYHRLIQALSENTDLAFFTYDLRGHGRSDGKRGVVKKFSEYLVDFATGLNWLKEELKITESQMFLLGHSMGGLITLRHLVENKDSQFKGAVFSAPFLGLSKKVPLVKDFGSLVLNQLAPSLTLSNEITNEDVTSDPLVIEEFLRDTLRHSRINAGTYLGSLESIELVSRLKMNLKGPMFFQLPENDPVVSTRDTLKLIKDLAFKDLETKIYPDRKHESYNDLGREEVFKDLNEWLAKQIG